MAGKKNRKSVLIASCAMAALIVGSSTFAWFTSVDEVVNQISASNEYNVVVKENFIPPNNWIPGQKVDKEVGAVNTGNIDAFVKATLTGNLVLTSKSSTTASVNDADFTQNAVVLNQHEFVSKQAGGLLVYKGDSAIEAGMAVSDIKNAEHIESGSETIADTAGYYIFARSTTQNQTGATIEIEYAGYYYDGTANYYDIEITPDTTTSNYLTAKVIQTKSKTVAESDLVYSMNNDGTIKVAYDAGTVETDDDIIINLELGDSVQSADDATITSDWIYVLNEENAKNVVFYYNKILESGKSTDSYIIKSVTLDSSVENDAFLSMDFNLKVRVDSAQISTEEDDKTQVVNELPWAVRKATVTKNGEVETVVWNVQ